MINYEWPANAMAVRADYGDHAFETGGSEARYTAIESFDLAVREVEVIERDRVAELTRKSFAQVLTGLANMSPDAIRAWQLGWKQAEGSTSRQAMMIQAARLYELTGEGRKASK